MQLAFHLQYYGSESTASALDVSNQILSYDNILVDIFDCDSRAAMRERSGPYSIIYLASTKE